jgi:hypothetical protein
MELMKVKPNELTFLYTMRNIQTLHYLQINRLNFYRIKIRGSKAGGMSRLSPARLKSVQK